LETLGLEIEQRNGAVHLRLTGELDLATSRAFESALARLEADRPPVAIIDLSGLGFIDSTGLSAVMRASQRADDRGGRLAIVRGPAAVHRVFEMTGLDRSLEILGAPEDEV
jgi:anti-sigma B factor antagonist